LWDGPPSADRPAALSACGCSSPALGALAAPHAGCTSLAPPLAGAAAKKSNISSISSPAWRRRLLPCNNQFVASVGGEEQRAGAVSASGTASSTARRSRPCRSSAWRSRGRSRPARSRRGTRPAARRPAPSAAAGG